MPKVTVYIRTDDYDRWRDIKHKTAFISAALNREPAPKKTSPLPAYPKNASPSEKGFIKATYIDKDQLP